MKSVFEHFKGLQRKIMFQSHKITPLNSPCPQLGSPASREDHLSEAPPGPIEDCQVSKSGILSALQKINNFHHALFQYHMSDLQQRMFR